jgi:hypothetical protein
VSTPAAQGLQQWHSSAYHLKVLAFGCNGVRAILTPQNTQPGLKVFTFQT